jgi:chemotaxis protein methyltransferase CheR
LSEHPAAGKRELTAHDMARVTRVVYALTGMTFGEKKQYYIQRRIDERMAQLNISDVNTYLTLAEAGGTEAQQIINAFTVNETYFYREDHQLASLTKDILPEIVSRRRPGDLIRIWSVPCSTGEEPYSVAIWLLENWPIVDVYNVEIVGSDIDTAVVAAAQYGLFSARSLARLSPAVIDAYFEPEKNGHRKIIDDLRDSVRFTSVNLVDAQSMAGQGKFDVILCRNLLIYFDDASKMVAADNLYRALNPGGFVCLGHSESMTRISDRFVATRFEDAIVYRKS